MIEFKKENSLFLEDTLYNALYGVTNSGIIVDVRTSKENIISRNKGYVSDWRRDLVITELSVIEA